MPTEHDIRALCQLVIEAKGTGEFSILVRKLRAALREHMQNMENLGIHMILNAPKPKVTIKTDKTED